MTSGLPAAVLQQATSLEGVLERVTFASEENGFCVVRLTVPGRHELVTAVGNLFGAQPGESLRLTGRWVTDRRYGEQFEVERALTVKPATLVGIEKYLASGLVRGVGKVMAARLVQHFGLATLDVIDAQPHRLTEVDGIGAVRSGRLRAAWAEQREIREVMVFLQAHGVSTGFAVKIYRQYRHQAIAVVKENPYRLAIDVFGIGFKTADRIAANLGLAPTSPRRAEAAVLHFLGEASDEGHVFLPRERLVATTAGALEVDAAIVEAAVEALASSAEVILEPLGAPAGAAVFLKSLHVAEAGVGQLLQRLLAAPADPLDADAGGALAGFERQRGLALAPEQRDAIRLALASKVLVVTGGPGTGKTTLVTGVLRAFAQHGQRVLLGAPTGRAAKRLGETTGHEARTLHRLLEFSPKTHRFERDRRRPLEADAVLVDEASMLDTVLAYDLLKALPPRCRLVLVGDVDQLPSVGPGTVLGDVIASGAVPVVRLRHIFRQAQQSLIVTNAHRVNQGRFPELRGAGEPGADFFFVEAEQPEQVLDLVKRSVAERIPRRFGVDAVDDVQVLTPMHRGLLGAANLNAELQALLNPGGDEVLRGSRRFRAGDKVMQLRNNYDLDVYNGDVGRVVAVDAAAQALRVAFDGREVGYDFADLDELALSYACSIHKSQGSEYPCVVLPLHTQHNVMLQRNLLYTGLTRGRRLVVLVGSRRALAIAVKNAATAARFTRLAAGDPAGGGVGERREAERCAGDCAAAPVASVGEKR